MCCLVDRRERTESMVNEKTHVCPRCKGAKFAPCMKRDATGEYVVMPERCGVCSGGGAIYGRLMRHVSQWPQELICWSEAV